MGSQIPTKWNWTGQRLKAAKLMALGDYTQEEVAKECRVTRETINVWNKVPEFHEKVVELVLADERATKAGILKRALKTLDKKTELAADDKTTELDYLKFIADIMGITDQKTGVNIINAVGISNTPEVKDAANSLCKRIRETLDATIEQ